MAMDTGPTGRSMLRTLFQEMSTQKKKNQNDISDLKALQNQKMKIMEHWSMWCPTVALAAADHYMQDQRWEKGEYHTNRFTYWSRGAQHFMQLGVQ